MMDTAKMLLYVPYESEPHGVNNEIKNKLTEDEFFQKCFVEFDWVKEIEKLKKYNVEDFEEDESNVSGEILKRRQIDALETMGKEINNFYNWLENGGESVFCIKGDAGVGKTSFLYYLKYKDKKNLWKIIDIQKARERVSILKGYEQIDIPFFRELEFKVISVMIDCITDCIFETNEGRQKDETIIFEAFKRFMKKYRNKIDNSPFISEFVRSFFECPDLSDFNTQREMRLYARHIKNQFKSILDIHQENAKLILYDLWSIYELSLEIYNDGQKCIICFDNFERFVGSEEIWNRQLWDFIYDLRHLIQNRVEDNNEFHKQFQFIVSMRNTTSRMSNQPLQSIEFEPNEVDISDIFPIEEIINKKIKWLDNNNFDVPEKDLVEIILGKKSFDGSGIRSLRTKLCRLFNNNKRYLIQFMARCIKETNRESIEEFSKFVDNNYKLSRSMNLYAARTIMLRIFMDGMLNDNFFEHLLVANKSDTQKRLGISRKILIVLKKYTFQNGNKYMPFVDFIRELFGKPDSMECFLGNNWSFIRRQVSMVLFYMNYYNNDKLDWTHFVDIQYNSKDIKDYLVSGYNDLEQLIIDNYDKIGIRIMTGGEAYLEYIVPAFEYFACRAAIGEKGEYYPPLFTLLPSKKQMESDNLKIRELRCIKLIDRVFQDADKCIKQLCKDSDTERLVFCRTIDDRKKRTQIERIVDLHSGYIGNFIQFIDKLYGNSDNENVENNYNQLREELRIYINSYDGLKEEKTKWLK